MDYFDKMLELTEARELKTRMCDTLLSISMNEVQTVKNAEMIFEDVDLEKITYLRQHLKNLIDSLDKCDVEGQNKDHKLLCEVNRKMQQLEIAKELRSHPLWHVYEELESLNTGDIYRVY